jgi:hypothetical protein
MSINETNSNGAIIEFWGYKEKLLNQSPSMIERQYINPNKITEPNNNDSPGFFNI